MQVFRCYLIHLNICCLQILTVLYFISYSEMDVLKNIYIPVFVNLAIVLSHISFGILSCQRLCGWKSMLGLFRYYSLNLLLAILI